MKSSWAKLAVTQNHIDTMQQAQSFYSVILRGSFSIYEMRIFLQIVRRLQPLYNGGKYSDFLMRPICTDGVNLNFAIPISVLMGSKSHNYTTLKAAIRHMEEAMHVEYYDKQRRIWNSSATIYNVRLYEREGMMTFSCPKWLFDYIADFSNGGYRLYDFERAMSLRNPSAARLYLLTASMEKTAVYSISEIKKMLGCADKYSKTNDFIKRKIKPAADELEKKGYNGFTYKVIRQFSAIAGGDVEALQISPVKREQKVTENIGVTVERLKSTLPEIFINYMQYSIGFTWQEMRGNEATFKAFLKHEDWQRQLSLVVDRARRKRKGKGYIIAAMKKINAS